jgi:hypothetical protein
VLNEGPLFDQSVLVLLDITGIYRLNRATVAQFRRWLLQYLGGWAAPRRRSSIIPTFPTLQKGSQLPKCVVNYTFDGGRCGHCGRYKKGMKAWANVSSTIHLTEEDAGVAKFCVNVQFDRG